MSGVGQVRATLLEKLTELQVPAMRAGFEETARRAEKETLSYAQYLLELSVRECEQRRGNRMRRRLQDSGLPLEKSLENFDLKRMPARVSRQLKVLLEGGFLDRKENVLAFGTPGAGKSHLLCAVAQELIAAQDRRSNTPPVPCSCKTCSWQSETCNCVRKSSDWRSTRA